MSGRPVSCWQSPGVGIRAGARGGADEAAWGLSQSRVCNWERVCNPRPGQAVVGRWNIWEDDWVLWRAGPEIPGAGGGGGQERNDNSLWCCRAVQACLLEPEGQRSPSTPLSGAQERRLLKEINLDSLEATHLPTEGRRPPEHGLQVATWSGDRNNCKESLTEAKDE